MTADLTPGAPSTRRRRAFGWLVAGCVLVLVAGVVAAQFIKSPAQVAAETAPPPLTVLTAPVEQRPLSATVAMEGAVRARSTTTVSIPESGDTAGQQVVTAVKVKRRQQVRPGTVLLEVSDRPLIVLEGGIPPYRDLAPGSNGNDVARVQLALHRLGYSTGADRAGSYGAGTSAAVRRMYRDRGYQPRTAAGKPTDAADGNSAAASPGAVLPASEVVFLQGFPARVQQVMTSVGDTGGGDALRLASGTLVVAATVAQADGESLAEGQRATVVFDDGREQRARVVTIRPQASGGNGGEDDSDAQEAQYAVTARAAGELVSRDLGAQVRLVVATGGTGGPVLVVPVAAVSTDEAGRSFVTVVSPTGQQRRVEVVVGFLADGYVEVTPAGSGLAAGDRVRLGIAAPGQLSTVEDGNGEPAAP